jgi:hypothetical protein
MAGSLSLSASSDVKVYTCPNCKETINTSMTQCSFCSAALDQRRPGWPQLKHSASSINSIHSQH